MRIAIFTDTMDRAAMGTALCTHRLIEELIPLCAEKSHTLSLVHTSRTKDPIYEQAEEVLLPRIRLPRFARIFSEALFLWRTRNQFDVIHYPQESNYPLFFLTNARIVVTVHSHIEGWRDWGHPARYRFVRGTLWLLKWLGGGIVCMSESVEESIIRNFHFPRERIWMVSEGVDQSFFDCTDKARARHIMQERYHLPVPYILVPSRIDPHKNIGRVVEAYAQVTKKRHIPHTLVLGSGHMPAETARIHRLIEELHIADRVVYKPFIEEADMPALYAGADITVYPSLHEGFGLPILESMAAGTAVVTSNIYSMPEVAGGNALLVDPYDPDSIADAIEELLFDDALRDRLVDQGRIHAKSFSWKDMAVEVLRAY